MERRLLSIGSKTEPISTGCCLTTHFELDEVPDVQVPVKAIFFPLGANSGCDTIME